MLNIPILRQGKPYIAVDAVDIVHHATGQPVARVAQANSGMLSRDIARMPHDILDQFTVAELMDMTRRAGDLFMTASLPLGDDKQSFDDYITQLSATTGMPVSYCRSNAGKIHRMFAEIETVIKGLTRGFPLDILDKGHGQIAGHTLSFFRVANCLGAVLPSNSPGVHSLWLPAIALKTPVVLKPGREEPWSPFRIIQAFIAAGVPAEAFGFYPTDHAGAAELLRCCDRSMLFGGSETTKPYENDSRVELHGPGYSKIILGPDAADEWEKYIDVMVGSIVANGGRSCINASAIWTPKNGRAIAEALSDRLTKVQALPAEDPKAEIAAFANPKMAEMISLSIDGQLKNGAIDITAVKRGSGRLVQQGRLAWLLPTIIWIEPHTPSSSTGECRGEGDSSARSPDRQITKSPNSTADLGDGPSWKHPLANKEFLFPFAAVVECPADVIPDAIGDTLVGTVITSDKQFLRAMRATPHIDRLNLGPIPTYQLSWDQPHEGNLFEHLYRQRAFQMVTA
ncbi:MAG: aldehyde dehydrogenase [Planctomycetes bacterium]|nr:aldehyde dehydrogenase [Planctomycetota bacterium]